MKRVYLLIICIATLLMSGCLKSVEDLNFCSETTYTGRVVDKATGVALSNREVVLADWDHVNGSEVENSNLSNVIARTFTNSSGCFALKLDYGSLNEGGYPDLIVLRDNDYYGTVFELQGAGKPTYDYGTIKLLAMPYSPF